MRPSPVRLHGECLEAAPSEEHHPGRREPRASAFGLLALVERDAADIEEATGEPRGDDALERQPQARRQASSRPGAEHTQQTAIGPEDPQHLPDRGGRVRKRLEDPSGRHEVERPCREREGLEIALDPVRPDDSGTGEHPAGTIEHRHTRSRFAGEHGVSDRTGAGAGVEHADARAQGDAEGASQASIGGAPGQRDPPPPIGRVLGCDLVVDVGGGGPGGHRATRSTRRRSTAGSTSGGAPHSVRTATATACRPPRAAASGVRSWSMSPPSAARCWSARTCPSILRSRRTTSPLPLLAALRSRCGAGRRRGPWL